MLKPSTPGKIVRIIFDLEGLVHTDSLGMEMSWYSRDCLISEMEELIRELKEPNK